MYHLGRRGWLFRSYTVSPCERYAFCNFYPCRTPAWSSARSPEGRQNDNQQICDNSGAQRSGRAKENDSEHNLHHRSHNSPSCRSYQTDTVLAACIHSAASRRLSTMALVMACPCNSAIASMRTCRSEPSSGAQLQLLHKANQVHDSLVEDPTGYQRELLTV